MTLRARDRIALVVVLFLVLAGAYYLFALRPEQRKAKSLDAAIVTQRQALTAAQQPSRAGTRRAGRAACEGRGVERGQPGGSGQSRHSGTAANPPPRRR